MFGKDYKSLKLIKLLKILKKISKIIKNFTEQILTKLRLLNFVTVKSEA